MVTLPLLLSVACFPPEAGAPSDPTGPRTTTPEPETGLESEGTETESEPEPETEPEFEETADTGPDEYVYDDPPDEDAPPLEAAALEAAIEELWGRVRAIDPKLLHDTYESQRLTLADDDCPYYDQNYYDLYAYWYWYDYCTATTGASFSGYGQSYWYDPYTSGYVEYESLSYFYGDAVIQDAEGWELKASGYAAFQKYGYTWDDYEYVSAYTSGSYASTHPGAEGSWLQDEVTLELSQATAWSATSGAQSWSLDGSASWKEGTIVAADFDAFVVLNAAAGSDCPDEPAGTLSLRDVNGNWYDLTFNGAPYAGAPVFPLTCDGCVDVVHDGQVQYAVCPDLTTLVAWEHTPW